MGVLEPKSRKVVDQIIKPVTRAPPHHPQTTGVFVKTTLTEVDG
jgi:hypothetical protein